MNLDRHQVESQPLREVGDHNVRIRLTYDLTPEVKVTVIGEEVEVKEEPEKPAKKPRSAKIEEVVEAAKEMEG